MAEINCIFCKIIKGEIPCIKVYEDNKILAFLDINPEQKCLENIFHLKTLGLLIAGPFVSACQ